MNIHFTDKELFERLKAATLAKVIVGSHLYGTNTLESDLDWLHIYATSENELKSFVWTNHQLQYKEDGVDHNFVSLHSFVRNIINGDSTINFEVVHSDALENTILELLMHMKDIFNTYTMIRSYNGLAKRDCKHWIKAKTDRDRLKKYGHIVRGYIYAQLLMHRTFRFDLANKALIHHMSYFKSGEKTLSIDNVHEYNDLLDIQRKELNSLLESKDLKLAKVMKVQDGLDLEMSLKLLQYKGEFLQKQNKLKLFDMDIFINAFENWVSYD